ncbi:DNA translocase FtsK, partial [Methylopila henanensis]
MRFSGRPPASSDLEAGRGPGDARRPQTEVRSVRTPDRVLRERRAARDETLDASVAVDPGPSAGDAQRAPHASRIEFIVDAAPAPVGSPLPSWLQPFAISPNTRFTRTPDSILRGHAQAPDDGVAPIEPEAAADAIAGMSFDDAPAPAPVRQPATLRRLADAIRLEGVAPEAASEQDNAPLAEAFAPEAPEPDPVAPPAAFLTGSLGQPFGGFAPVSYSASFAWAPTAPAPAAEPGAPAPAPAAPKVEAP